VKKATLFGLLGILCLVGGCKQNSQSQPAAKGSKPNVVQAASPAAAEVSSQPVEPAPLTAKDPVSVQPPPASALLQPKVLDAATAVILKVWTQRPPMDDAKTMLAGLGFAPFKCSPPKDKTLANVTLDCVAGTLPVFEFHYYRGSLESVNISFQNADRTSYNNISDELKKSANLGEVQNENEDSRGVLDTWEQGEMTCSTGRTCPQSALFLSYSPKDADSNMRIAYIYNPIAQRSMAEYAAELVRGSQ